MLALVRLLPRVDRQVLPQRGRVPESLLAEGAQTVIIAGQTSSLQQNRGDIG